MSRTRASRYQPLLVALHWVLALLIIGLLCLGYFVLARMPNSDPKKLDILIWHMSGGISVLLLMIVRVIIRARSARPPSAPDGSSLLSRLGSVEHAALYGIVFLLAVSGWSTGFMIRGVFAPHGAPLPGSFAVFPTFRIHAVLAALLAMLIAAHVAAALYHQFVLKDRLLRRMWFGKRIIAAARVEASSRVQVR